MCMQELMSALRTKSRGKACLQIRLSFVSSCAWSEKNMGNLSQDTRRSVRDSNPVPSKHKPVFVLPLWSVHTLRDNWKLIQINQPTRCNNFSSLLSWRLFTAQHVSVVLPPIIRSSVTAVAASGFTSFHKRYCIVNLQLKRDRRYCFAKFTVTIKLI